MSRNATPSIPLAGKPARAPRAPRPIRDTLPPAAGTLRPLVLDLDGTLLRTDMLFECVARLLRRNPLMLFALAVWLLQGRALLKARLARHADLDVSTLPVDRRILDLAEKAAAEGRAIVLATAADEGLAHAVAKRFPVITRVMASQGGLNLKGAAKAEALKAAFPQGFDYAGDSAADLSVFAAAEAITVVRGSAAVLAGAEALGKPMTVLAERRPAIAIWARALRLKQWAKNALIFAPIPLAGVVGKPDAWLAAGLAFLGLGLAASATYLVNDLVDLDSDRRHWSKQERPLASGALPIRDALLATPLLLAAGLGLAALAGTGVLLATLLYVAVTLSYSLGLKKVPILDLALLAGLFTLRLFIGVVAIGTVLSPWLFVFSMALFLSLSAAKRHTELARARLNGSEVNGRGYRPADEPLLLGLGLAAVASSVLILILYLMAEGFRAGQYSAPGFLWAMPAIIFLWQMRIWLLSQRGELDDDPVAFAIRDQVSLQLGAALGLAFLAAYLGGALPWR